MPKALPFLTETASQATRFHMVALVVKFCFLILLLLTLSVTARAQFTDINGLTYTTNGGSITITGHSFQYIGDLTIPSTINGLPVRSIGDEAFKYRTDINSVTIPSSVTSIGASAFYQSGFASVTISKNVTNIGTAAFGMCFGLQAISVDPVNPFYSSSLGVLFNKPRNVLIQYPLSATIAFYTIPEGVTRIVDDAFLGSYRLTGVMIPNSVTNIGVQWFEQLAAYYVGAENQFYSSVDGVLFTKKQDTLLAYPRLKIGASYTITQTVTSVGKNAFFQCFNLTNVTMGSSVTSLGDSAFALCAGLTRLTIPTSLTTLGDSVFRRCTGLTNLTIPDSVTNIGDSAFTYCTGLRDLAIGNGVVAIGNAAFAECRGLSKVVIPNSVTSIGDLSFYDCYSLENIVIPNTVTNIGDSAFHTAGLVNINIPGSITRIANSAFGHCTGLTNLMISNGVNSIGSYAFDSCTSLKSVSIPGSVTSIGDSAFYLCTGLKSVTIADGVASIGDSAFSDCNGLASVSIPSSMTNIGYSAFSSVALSAIVVAADNPYFSSLEGVLFDKTQRVLRQYPGGRSAGSYAIPNSVTSIGAFAFFRCTVLRSLEIPDSVTDIGDSAFYFCGSLTGVTIGNGVTRIGNFAFYSCSALTSVTIGDGLTSVGNSAFEYCGDLTRAYFKGNRPSAGADVFNHVHVTSYYLPGTTGWGTTFDYSLTALWNPEASTADSSFGVKAGQFGFTITASNNIQVVVEACDNLSFPIWLPLSTNILTFGSSCFADSAWTNHPSRFYRFRSP